MPPEIFAAAVPLGQVEQEAGVAVKLKVSAEGAIVMVSETAHPFASVTKTMHEAPGHKPVMEEDVEPEHHRKEYGAVPPPALALAEPSQTQALEALVPVAEATKRAGCVITVSTVVVHPLESVMTSVYPPAQSPVMFAVVFPEGNHKYVYAGVPPEAEMVMEPLHPPLHFTLPAEVMFPERTVGWVTVTVAVFVQVAPSVTRTE